MAVGPPDSLFRRSAFRLALIAWDQHAIFVTLVA
jgi:hypothetical protein